jgi:hypothetical protein
MERERRGDERREREREGGRERRVKNKVPEV